VSAENDQIIYDTAIKEGFSPTAAKLVVAQARYESADYTSNVFRLNKNTSGMKFIGQPLAKKGSLAPPSERSQQCRRNNICRDSDYYAKFDSVGDSAKDKIFRNYNLTIKGVTPEQLKNAQTPEEFARLLKIRGYYGIEQDTYSAGLKAKLRRIQVVEFVESVKKNKNRFVLVGGLVLLGFAYYFYFNKKNN